MRSRAAGWLGSLTSSGSSIAIGALTPRKIHATNHIPRQLAKFSVFRMAPSQKTVQSGALVKSVISHSVTWAD